MNFFQTFKTEKNIMGEFNFIVNWSKGLWLKTFFGFAMAKQCCLGGTK